MTAIYGGVSPPDKDRRPERGPGAPTTWHDTNTDSVRQAGDRPALDRRNHLRLADRDERAEPATSDQVQILLAERELWRTVYLDLLERVLHERHSNDAA